MANNSPRREEESPSTPASDERWQLFLYREELLGIYHCLSMTLQTFKKVQAISCHCDSEAAISKSREAPAYPGQFVTADMDIILAIQRLVQDSETRISFNHVPGHPEKRKRKEDFTFIELANWECDRDAEEHITSPVPPIPICSTQRCQMCSQNTWRMAIKPSRMGHTKCICPKGARGIHITAIENLE